jgi:cell division protein FtsA
VQLVQGPQYATGVGLLRYGAQQLADRAHQQAPAARGRMQSQPEEAETAHESGGKSGFWSWFRAAF